MRTKRRKFLIRMIITVVVISLLIGLAAAALQALDRNDYPKSGKETQPSGKPNQISTYEGRKLLPLLVILIIALAGGALTLGWAVQDYFYYHPQVER